MHGTQPAETDQGHRLRERGGREPLLALWKPQEASGTLPNLLSGNWNTGEGPKPKSRHGGCEATDRDDSDESLGHVRLRGHAPSHDL